MFGGGIVGRVRGFDGDGFDLFGGAFGLQRRGFGIFGNVGSQNVRPFIGRALLNERGIVGFEVGKRFSWSFCRRALGRAVLNEDAGAVGRSVAGSLGGTEWIR